MVTIQFSGATLDDAKDALRAAIVGLFPVLSFVVDGGVGELPSVGAGVVIIDRVGYRIMQSTGEGLKNYVQE